jgi:copper chaperone CopZ
MKEKPMMDDPTRSPAAATTFTVEGMTCGHCENAVKTEIGRLVGVERVDVNLATGMVTVFADRAIDRADVVAAVTEAGYLLVPSE